MPGRSKPVKTFHGKIIGYLIYKSNGNITATNFLGKILDRSDFRSNVIRNFLGRVLFKGNIVAYIQGRKQQERGT